MKQINDLKEALMDELEDYSNKPLSESGLKMIDCLAHAIKNIDRIIETYEEEGYSQDGGSYRGSYDGQGGSYRSSYEGQGGNRGGNQGGGRSNRGGSYARGGRGRGRNARRDSMGRYSSDYGYSRAEDDIDSMISELREMMGDLPQEKKQAVQRFVQQMEQMG